MARPPYTVLYDGDCPMCSAAARRIERSDREGALELLPAPGPESDRRFPGISREALRESVHLVGPGGDVWSGAEAVEQLIRVLPRWRWLAPFFHLPFVRPLSRRIYRWVARNRYRLTCGDHCSGKGK